MWSQATVLTRTYLYLDSKVMMPPREWKNLVIDSVSKIADGAYQERSWLGRGPEVSSPEECYSTLFDDYLFEDF